MNSPDPIESPAVITPAAVPWYRSRIIQGVLTIVVTQAAAKIEARYHIDLNVLGVSVDDVVQGAMNGIAAVAAYWAIHARVSQKVPVPPVVTLTAAQAQKIVSAQVEIASKAAPK